MKIRHRISSAVAGLASILILASGCGEPAPTEVGLRPGGLQVGSVVTAARSAVPYLQGTYAAEIGPEGGTLHFGVGSLSFPQGAISSRTLITASVDGLTIGAEFGPRGLLFPAGSEPTLKFYVAPPLQEMGRILYVDRHDRVLEVLGSRASESSSVQAELSHFSKYIFGAN